ncbi:MAG: type IV pilus assembly protein PilM [Patescibacteria group bacterium]
MQNLWNNFLTFLGSLKQKESSAIGIDIGSSFIKIVQLKKKGGKAILETYGELALGPYADLEPGQVTSISSEKLSEALLDIMKEANITSKNAAISIPFASSMVTLIDLPNISETDLASVIPLEARKYIPVPASEVTLDWWVIPKEDEYETETEKGESKKKEPQKISVLVAAIHKDAINKYQDIVKRVGLEKVFFEIETFSTIRSTFGRDMKLVMVLDFGASGTKLSIVENGVVKGSHSVGRGSQDVTVALSTALGVTISQAEEMKRIYGLLGKPDDSGIKETIELSTDYIFSEVNRVLLNYEKKYNKTIGKIILTGGGVLMKGFKERAAERLQSDVIYGDPFAKVEAPAFLSELLEEAGPEFAVAIGLALRKLRDS